MSDCFRKNELLIPGTRQDQRLNKALNPDYVYPDERSIPDILVFIAKYAKLINYFAIKGKDQKDYVIDGDWRPLIMSDEAFNYAGIAITERALPNITFYKYINNYETGSTTVNRNIAYRALWDVLFTVYRDINAFYMGLPTYMPLRNVVQTEISNNLVSDFGLASGAYLNDNLAISPFDLQVITNSADDDYKFGFADDIIKEGFDTIWIDKTIAPLAAGWNQYLAALNPNVSIAQKFFNIPDLSDPQNSIDYSTLQLKQIFKRAFETYARIIGTANEYLQNSLENNSSHFAHHGLMLAFVKLFGILQTDVNEFTRKHLEYYYSRVLQIRPAAAVPDAAHLVIEPAKNITSHLIKKNSALNAGKDETGKILLYNSDNEIVINQAKIEQLKTVFLKPGISTGSIDRIYASPVANSADGKGEPFTSEDISWKGFGDIHTNEVSGIESNSASLGFYIASPVLHLTEGNRVVEFIFTTDSTGITNINNLTQSKLIKLLSFSFSGEKQWEQLIIQEDSITDYNCELAFIPPFTGTTFSITLTIKEQCKPLVGYDKSVCDGDLNTIYPVIRFALNQNNSEPNAYESFRNITISKITINTTVSEIKGLSLQNDNGALDASKPMQPFGSNPKKGSTFYIGHSELQYKAIQSFDITLTWMDYNGDLKNYYQYKAGGTDNFYVIIADESGFKVRAGFLRNKQWLKFEDPYPLYDDDEITEMNITVTDLTNTLVKPESYKHDIISFSTETQNGFISLQLNEPAAAFGHAKWAPIFAQQTVAYNALPSDNTIPNPPYTPLLQSVKLQYVASQDINLDVNCRSEQGQFFHLLPFGNNELNKEVITRPDYTVFLLPDFKHHVKNEDGYMMYKQTESALFFGISNTEIKQNISLLIQVNEGSEDISIDTPKVSWNYLSNTGWKNLDKSLLADSTGNLLKSGIVNFSVPVDVNNKSTELPIGFTWILAAIEPDTDGNIQTASQGLPKILAVYTNAIKATFANHENDPEHLAKALPANSISKFFESDAAVKKVIQPYASFAGKKTEEGIKFYTRVSERLRHKHRAVGIWDYERLILNEFPEVYMVKCLNHTGYEKDCTTSTLKYKENIAGQVMLVPVPFVTNLQTGNIYQPTLSAAKLMTIKNFIHGDNSNGACNKIIKPLHCQLATLLVENPKYETIKVSCKIKIKECFDADFYKTQLSRDLNKFLSPWITGDAAKINFGGRLHASQVVYFIEKLPYIDYLEDLTMEQKDGSTLLNISELFLAVATKSCSVLTSIENDGHGNPQHNIILL